MEYFGSVLMDNLWASNYLPIMQIPNDILDFFLFSVQLWRNIYSRNPELCHKPKMKGMPVIIYSINL